MSAGALNSVVLNWILSAEIWTTGPLGPCEGWLLAPSLGATEAPAEPLGATLGKGVTDGAGA